MFKLNALSLALAMLVSTSALAVKEVEMNNPVANGQTVAITAVQTAVEGMLGDTDKNDVDFYVISANAGDVINVDIDKGYGDDSSIDTLVVVLGPAPDYRILRLNDNSSSVDPGSVSNFDPFLANVKLPWTGRYTIGVVNASRSFNLYGGTTRVVRGDGSITKAGDYELVITGLEPQVKQINIDVKPGAEDLAPINPKSKGKIPVAIMGSQDFDAMSVNPSSLTFGAKGDEPSFVKCDYTGTDVDGDGRLDRVCHFENQIANFSSTDREGILRGVTTSGMKVEGRAFLKVK